MTVSGQHPIYLLLVKLAEREDRLGVRVVGSQTLLKPQHVSPLTSLVAGIFMYANPQEAQGILEGLAGRGRRGHNPVYGTDALKGQKVQQSLVQPLP